MSHKAIIAAAGAAFVLSALMPDVTLAGGFHPGGHAPVNRGGIRNAFPVTSFVARIPFCLPCLELRNTQGNQLENSQLNQVQGQLRIR